MPSIPGPIKAWIGLAVTVVDEVKQLPNKVIEVPMTAVSTALQASMRVQQRYTGLVVRGDELIKRVRGVPDEPPAWATFDEPLADPTPVTRLRPGRHSGPDAGLDIFSGSAE